MIIKIILLVAEILFTAWAIHRMFTKNGDGEYRINRFGTFKRCMAMVSVCIVNLLTVVGVGVFNDVGYIFDMVFLVFVIIQLLSK